MSFGLQSSSSGPQNATPTALQRNYGPFAAGVQNLLRTNIGRNFNPRGGIPIAPARMVGPGPNGIGRVQPRGIYQQVAPISAGERSSLAMLNQQAAATNPMITSYLSDVLGGQYLPGADKANPFLEPAIQAAQRPTQQALEDTLSRTLPSQFAKVGQFNQPQRGSSAFDTAAALAYGRGAQALSDIATNMSNTAYGSERQLQQGAVGLNQAQTQNLVQTLQANALPRLIQQQGISTGLGLFQQRIQNLLSSLGLVTQQSGASNIGQSSSSSGTQFGLGNLV